MWLRLAIFLLSAAALAYEILLARLLSIIQWHHFASLVIGLALLGYGASGTFLALARTSLLRRFEVSFVAGAVGFALSTVGCFALAQRLPFNPLEIVWSPGQLGYLAALQLLLALPFFCAATCIGLTLLRFRGEIHRIYRADLLGAGTGAALIVLALWHRLPGDCLLLVGAVPLFAAAAAGTDRRLRVPRRAVLLLAVAGVGAVAWPGGGPVLHPSPYKGLAMALRVPESRILIQKSSPLALLSVVASPRIPFRHAPGLSLGFPGELPEQLAVFADGDSMTVIDRAPASPEEPSYLDYLPSALPYQLLRAPRVAVVGGGGGAEVRAALRHGASRVVVVEPNRQMLELLLSDSREFAGDLYRHPSVVLHATDPRGFFAATSERFDLVQIAYPDAVGSGGAYALRESYLYTVESLERLIDRVSDGGLVAVTRWLRVPPRGALKLFATAAQALERQGVPRPGASLAMVRSWDSVVLLVKRGELTPGELAVLRRFCEARSFDLAYYPGMEAGEANRFNVLDEAYFFDGATALLGAQRRRFLESYKFEVEPATDDRPFFLHFMKWKALPELYRLRAQGGPALLEWGYLLLLAALVEAALAGVVLILVPLVLRGRGVSGSSAGRPQAARIALYFLSLGLAFLFLEIAFIQRFVLFLAHPVYAFAVALAAFLVFAGLGSGLCRRWAEWWRRRTRGQRSAQLSPIEVTALGVAVIGLLYLAVLPPLLARWVGWALPLKAALSVALIAPLALPMGMLFPLGLQRVSSWRPEWIPWAWGINGWASVLAALLANLLAVHLGFSAVVASACALYCVAAAAMRGVRAAAEAT